LRRSVGKKGGKIMSFKKPGGKWKHFNGRMQQLGDMTMWWGGYIQIKLKFGHICSCEGRKAR